MEIVSEVIRSRQNRTVVGVAKLTDRREREQTGLFRFDGIKLAGEALKAGAELPVVLLREEEADGLMARLKDFPAEDLQRQIGRVILLENSVFDRLSEEKSPEGIICVAKHLDKFQKNVTIYDDSVFPAGERIVLLEAVRDPVNLGAIIRSAAAFGVGRLILSADCADIYHPRTVRASMGALFRQRIDRTPELTGAITRLRGAGRRVYAAALDRGAARLGEAAFGEEDCIVIGNEGHGLRPQTIAACDGCVFIPMEDSAESLNAAVAASVLMWELGRGARMRKTNGGNG